MASALRNCILWLAGLKAGHTDEVSFGSMLTRCDGLEADVLCSFINHCMRRLSVFRCPTTCVPGCRYLRTHSRMEEGRAIDLTYSNFRRKVNAISTSTSSQATLGRLELCRTSLNSATVHHADISLDNFTWTRSTHPTLTYLYYRAFIAAASTSSVSASGTIYSHRPQ